MPWRAYVARALRAAETAQVELNGHYSAQRVHKLAAFRRRTSVSRALLIVVCTALPCLVTPLLLDIPRLADPTAGVSDNWLLFAREFVVWWLFSFLGSGQCRHFVSSLSLTLLQMVAISTVAATGSVASTVLLARLVGFPVPFSLVLAAPFWVMQLCCLIALTWSRRLKATPEARPQIVSWLKVWTCQCCLVSIYPGYFYVFTSLPQSAQLPFACLLPLIKVAVRNWLSRALEHLRDEMSEVVILNADIFSALFVAYCMQTVPSAWATAGLMAIDGAQILVAVRDIHRFMNEIARLQQEMNGSEASTPSVVDWTTVLDQADAVAARLHNSTSRVVVKKRTFSSSSRVSSSTPRNDTAYKSKSPREPRRVTAQILRKVLPAALAGPKLAIAETVERNDSTQSPRRISPRRRSLHSVERQFVDTVGRLLFLTEFLLLLNYIEVVIPVVYAIQLIVFSQLPNRAYYSSLAGVDDSALLRMALNVLAYGLLELVSLALLCWLLTSRLRFSAVVQLAFLLRQQWDGVQIKLVLWVLWAAQSPLQHFGFDYSFKFAWLRDAQE